MITSLHSFTFSCFFLLVVILFPFVLVQLVAEIATLQEMFPVVPKQVFEGMLRDNLPIDMIIDILVDRDLRAPLNLSTVLSSHAEKAVNLQRDVSLTMTRACIWNKAKQFYKACLQSPSQLRKNL